ncbi:hypothetical protein S2E19_04504 [Bacillus mycoides]|uniref:hypothetical protein n=1 Tax=Bacillus mycoides TaxID=1405 RepID=UPI000A27AB6E|nr:hypothetical protein [Bacillus mycoides]OSX89547.1 hypothetical protein BTJ45_04852 [Bacillus mycoides]OSY00727.1 hypothetical protein S2E19_04504 [Bacillus mycoides]
MKKDAQNKEIKEKLELVCDKNPNCCAYGPKCPGTYVVFPSGNLGFQHCGC